MPMPPVTAAAMSVRMSPKRLSVTTTSYRCGLLTMNMLAASMCWYSVATSGKPAATAANVRAHRLPAFVSTLVLCTSVRWRRSRRCARANASRTTRSTPCRVLRLSSVAISAGVSLCSTPPAPA